MSCRKIQSLFEAGDLPEGVFVVDGELAKHAAQCCWCGEFLRRQTDVAAGMALLRSSAPPTSSRLDMDVLRNFRRQVPALQAPFRRFPIAFPLGRWRWGVVAAAVAILVFAAILLRPKPGPVDITVMRTEPHAVSSPAKQQIAQKTVAVKVGPRVKPGAHYVSRSQTSAVENSSLTAGFRSLMFCDAISCDGNMELVRIQLPSPAMPLSASAQPRATSAEVLIGEDGVARAIRIVE